jgi:nucleoside-diphosphate-sugar epimerase
MQALVTGGTGFIGSHLVDELVSQGYTVRVLRRPTSTTAFPEEKAISFVIGDLTDKASLVKACHQVDVVFHVAALPRDWGPKKIFFEVNLNGTRNLLDTCVQNKIPRFVFMSSAAVYGFPKTSQPITEEYQKKPTAKYGESKLAAEQLVWEYGTDHNMMVSAIRSPLVIGSRDRMITPFLISALQQGRLFFIGDGTQKLSVSDGRDVAHCLRLAAETKQAPGQAYNVKSFDSTPKQLMETLATKLQVPAPQVHRSYPLTYLVASIIEGVWMLRGKQNPPLTRHKVKVLGHTRILDTTKAQQGLNYHATYSVTSTVNDLVEWYFQQPSHSVIGSITKRR